ncbi:unnamed protein product [Heterobilharzia americana]|nr:unnamed protein product [Heterobilharzia americana]
MNVACNRHDDNLPILFIDFNQDYTSIQVGTKTGYSLLSTVGDQVTETFSSTGDPMCIVGRLFNRSLVTLVSQNDMRRLLVAHSRINTLICHYRYTLTILAVKMNHQNVTSIAAHDGLLACLTFNARANLLATASEKGTVIRVFSVPQGEKVIEFRRGLTRCVSICCLSFSMNSQYLVAASHTETVHIFKLENRSSEKTPDVQTDHYTRQRTTSTSSGASQGAGCGTDDCDLPPSEDITGNYSGCLDHNASGLDGTTTGAAATMASWSQGLMGWMGSTLKTYSVYLPYQVSEIFAQDRAFAYARIPCASVNTSYRPPGSGSPVSMASTGELVSPNYVGPTSAISQSGLIQPSPGQRKVAALVYYQNQPRLIVAGLDGLVHIFSIDPVNGGEAVLIRTQRLLSPHPSNNQATTLSSVAMNPNSPYDSNSLPPSNITPASSDNITSKNVNCIRSGGPQQPGVYALPASAATTVNLTGTNVPVTSGTGKVNTFASVVAGAMKDEGVSIGGHSQSRNLPPSNPITE